MRSEVLVAYNTPTSFIVESSICAMSEAGDKKVKVLDSSPEYLNYCLAALSFLCAVCRWSLTEGS